MHAEVVHPRAQAADGCAPTGEMAERSIAAVLKTVDPQGSGGSNPSLSANNGFLRLPARLE